MSVAILGLGTAVPTHSVGQVEAAALASDRCCTTAEHERLLPVLYRRSRVARRGSVLIESVNGHGIRQSFFGPKRDDADRGPGTAARLDRFETESAPLAVEACGRALAAAGTPAASITHIVTVSCTGFAAPGLDVMLMKRLGIPMTSPRTNVGFMGCHGALNGLRVARALAAADSRSRVLVCAVELCSLHFHYGWDPERIVANALFADGAAALVCGAPEAGARTRWRIDADGSCVFPDSDDAMTWRIGDHGFEMTLSARVPDLIARHLRPWMDGWLSSHGLTVAKVGSWAIHPGGPRVLSTVAASLGLGADATRESEAVLEAHGNMSSPTTLFIVERLAARNAPGPWVAMGFGPGLAVEAALLSPA